MLHAQSTLTDRYQTTVPESIRRALRLGKRDRIDYTILATGQVVLTRAENTETTDPVMDEFLTFLAHDMAAHPERLQSLSADAVRHVQALTREVEVDWDAPLPDTEP